MKGWCVKGGFSFQGFNRQKDLCNVVRARGGDCVCIVQCIRGHSLGGLGFEGQVS